MKKVVEAQIKLRHIFYVLAGIWTVDLISTFIALNFFHGYFIESNPFQAQFFALGWYGWFLSIFVTYSIIFVLTIVIGILGIPIKKIEERKNVKGYYNFYLAYLAGIFSAIEITTVISNVRLLLGF
jgi:hypothetical protein